MPNASATGSFSFRIGFAGLTARFQAKTHSERLRIALAKSLPDFKDSIFAVVSPAQFPSIVYQMSTPEQATGYAPISGAGKLKQTFQIVIMALTYLQLETMWNKVWYSMGKTTGFTPISGGNDGYDDDLEIYVRDMTVEII